MIFVKRFRKSSLRFDGIACLSNEAVKNASENAAWINLIERLAILIGIDAPGHCFARSIANEADCKIVGTLAGNDDGALDPSKDDVGWSPNWV